MVNKSKREELRKAKWNVESKENRLKHAIDRKTYYEVDIRHCANRILNNQNLSFTYRIECMEYSIREYRKARNDIINCTKDLNDAIEDLRRVEYDGYVDDDATSSTDDCCVNEHD